MPDRNDKLNTVDLFSGAGGLSLGFEQAGYRTILGVEKDEKASATYRRNIPSACIEKDLSDSPELPVSSENVDVLIGGPPCQGFSMAGNREESDERNKLINSFLDYVNRLNPSIVVMENVKGILSFRDGEIVKDVHDKLNSEGYISEHKVLSAENFGVPQKRDRVFFIARNDGVAPKFPEPTSEEIVVGDVISHSDDEPNMTPPRHEEKTVDRIRETEQGNPLYDSYTQRIRLDSDDIAPTIVCGGPRPQWQLAHPTEDRGLTVRERASLQTFPDNYEFVGGVVSGRVQTGNAVPPKISKTIAEVNDAR